ncbi:MAG: type II CAAX endopeptidase family protein [Saprospiraceae bacterium]|nr:type II CAAX endopeptidase family protein [Saprospiraceae bacterium]
MKKLLKNWITRIILGIIACTFGTFLIKEFITFPLLNLFIDSVELKEGIQRLLSGLMIIVIYYYLYKFLEKRKLTELSTKSIWKDSFIGLLLGFGLISLCILLLYFLGFYQINGVNSFSNVLFPLTMLISAALWEEILFRAIIYRILEEKFGTKIALIQTLIFGVVHYGNENATISSVFFVILLGLAISLMYTYTQRIWLPFFFHVSWNFAQTIFGATLSGDNSFRQFFEGKFDGPSLYIGSVFGIEDSLFSIVFMTLLSIYLYWLCKKNKKIIVRN